MSAIPDPLVILLLGRLQGVLDNLLSAPSPDAVPRSALLTALEPLAELERRVRGMLAEG